MTTTTINGKEIEIYYANALPSGYGHKEITVELLFNGNFKKFKSVTSDMPGYDAANDLEGDEKKVALYELIESNIEGEVIEWLEERTNA